MYDGLHPVGCVPSVPCSALCTARAVFCFVQALGVRVWRTRVHYFCFVEALGVRVRIASSARVLCCMCVSHARASVSACHMPVSVLSVVCRLICMCPSCRCRRLCVCLCLCVCRCRCLCVYICVGVGGTVGGQHPSQAPDRPGRISERRGCLFWSAILYSF